MWVRGKDQRHVIDNMMKDLFAATGLSLREACREVYNANCPEDLQDQVMRHVLFAFLSIGILILAFHQRIENGAMRTLWLWD